MGIGMGGWWWWVVGVVGEGKVTDLVAFRILLFVDASRQNTAFGRHCDYMSIRKHTHTYRHKHTLCNHDVQYKHR